MDSLGGRFSIWSSISLPAFVNSNFDSYLDLLEGAYLALATLGLGESVRIMIAVTPAFGSSTGIMLIPAPVIGDFVFDSFERYYYLVMTVAVLGIS